MAQYRPNSTTALFMSCFFIYRNNCNSMEIKASSSSGSVPPAMGSESIEVYFVFMNSDTEYERLKQNRFVFLFHPLAI